MLLNLALSTYVKRKVNPKTMGWKSVQSKPSQDDVKTAGVLSDGTSKRRHTTSPSPVSSRTHFGAVILI